MTDITRQLEAGPDETLALLPPAVQAAARLGAHGRLVTRSTATFDTRGFPPLTPVLLVAAEVDGQHVDLGSVSGHAARTVVHHAAEQLGWDWLDGAKLWCFDGSHLLRYDP